MLCFYSILVKITPTQTKPCCETQQEPLTTSSPHSQGCTPARTLPRRSLSAGWGRCFPRGTAQRRVVWSGPARRTPLRAGHARLPAALSPLVGTLRPRYLPGTTWPEPDRAIRPAAAAAAAGPTPLRHRPSLPVPFLVSRASLLYRVASFSSPPPFFFFASPQCPPTGCYLKLPLFWPIPASKPLPPPFLPHKQLPARKRKRQKEKERKRNSNLSSHSGSDAIYPAEGGRSSASPLTSPLLPLAPSGCGRAYPGSRLPARGCAPAQAARTRFLSSALPGPASVRPSSG